MDATRLTLSFDEAARGLPASATVRGAVEPELLFEIVRALRLVGLGVEVQNVSTPAAAPPGWKRPRRRRVAS